jgi:hypothetical protein
VLVLVLNLHGFPALSNEVPMLSALVGHARASSSVLLVRVHALGLPAQQCEVLLAQHVELLIYIDTRQDKEKCLEDMLPLVLEPDTRARL